MTSGDLLHSSGARTGDATPEATWATIITRPSRRGDGCLLVRVTPSTFCSTTSDSCRSGRPIRMVGSCPGSIFFHLYFCQERRCFDHRSSLSPRSVHLFIVLSFECCCVDLPVFRPNHFISLHRPRTPIRQTSSSFSLGPFISIERQRLLSNDLVRILYTTEQWAVLCSVGIRYLFVCGAAVRLPNIFASWWIRSTHYIFTWKS